MASLVRWDPITDLMAMQRDMERLMTSVGMVPARRTTEQVPLIPSIDVLTRGDDLVVHAEIPGVKPDDIEISVNEGLLTISGKRHEEREVAEKDYLVRETSYGDFERSLRLPAGVDQEHVRADYHDGILEIVLTGAAHKAKPAGFRVPIHVTQPKAVEAHH